MFGAMLSALWSQDPPSGQPRTPDSATSLDASIRAGAAARLAAAHAQVAAMSAEERAPLAAAGRARFLGRLQECKIFASLEAGKAYRRQRLLELAAAIQEDIENNQPFSGNTKTQAPDIPSAASPAAEAYAEERIPAAWTPARAQQAKLSVKEPEGPSAAAFQPYGKQVPENAAKAGQQAQRRAAEVASVDALRAPASEADGRDQQHRQQQHPVAVAARARRFYPVSAEKKNQ